MLALGASLISSAYKSLRRLAEETFTGEIANWTAVNANITNATNQLAVQASSTNGYAWMSIDTVPYTPCSYSITCTAFAGAGGNDAHILIGKTLTGTDNASVDVTETNTFTGTFTTSTAQTKIFLVLMTNTNGVTAVWDNVTIDEV